MAFDEEWSEAKGYVEYPHFILTIKTQKSNAQLITKLEKNSRMLNGQHVIQ